ncbi:hypothetical protein HCN56_05955 [Streptomyces lonarensis]|uniref:Carrier domain-containing protein n=2 Tax=Streptomyces lonarensis TaxID=700599 RepID=A0A7X6HY21_9ACTN|nr:hypothetical protein [Streptomyces lonarensis]
MTGALADADLSTMRRDGVVAIRSDEGLALLDAAGALDRTFLVPVRLDLTGQSRPDVPYLMRDLVRGPARRVVDVAEEAPEPAENLRDRLISLRPARRERVLLDIVRGQAAATLGYAGAGDVDPERSFRDMGFDSLAAVRFRNTLGETVGERLPATLVFDHPTALVLTRHLLDEMALSEPEQAEPAEGGGDAEDTGSTEGFENRAAEIQGMSLAELLRTAQRSGDPT